MGGFRARNVISGKEARIYWGGEEIAYAKSAEANIEKTKSQIKVLGRVMDGSKVTSASGSGTLTLHKTTSKFAKMMREYVRTGIDQYFTVEMILDDKGAGRGTERVTLFDVNIDSVKIAALDVDSEGLEEEVPFTFEDFDMPEALLDTFR